MNDENALRILFVGDVVGDEGRHGGLPVLERVLPRLRADLRPHAVIVNAENVALTGRHPVAGCGLTPDATRRLFELGVDVITGGNHSWDGPHAEAVHADSRVLRPLNMGTAAPGNGSIVVTVGGHRLGVVNLASASALKLVDHPVDVLERQLTAWGDDVDAVLVDFHGTAVPEKQMTAWAFAGRVAAFLGTHTHVATMDARILPGGTAYVTDVGMTGPDGGMQGYDPEPFVDRIRTRLPVRLDGGFAAGPSVLGAVWIDVEGGRATAIHRCDPHLGENVADDTTAGETAVRESA